MNTVNKPVILITGGSGLIGNRVCQALGDGYKIVVLDRDPPEAMLVDREWVECDLTDDNCVRDALSKVQQAFGDQLASVIHLAAYYDFAGEPSPLYDKLTVQGTRRLMRELQGFREVEQFVFSSSLLVMQPCEPGKPLNEFSPTQAEWEYPQSKLAAESVIEEERGSIPAVVLRIAGVYDEDGHSIPITQNVRRIAEKEPESYFYPGDYERGQSFVHLDDLAQCFVNVVEKHDDLSGYQLFLIAEQECLSYENLQDRIGELVHGVEDWPTIRIPKSLAKAGAWVKEQFAGSESEKPFIRPWMVDIADAHYPVDNSRAQTMLDWHPQHQLSETLPEMIRRLKQDPQSWYERNHLPMPDNVDALAELSSSR